MTHKPTPEWKVNAVFIAIVAFPLALAAIGWKAVYADEFKQRVKGKSDGKRSIY